jgi:hypothetical protein
MRASKVMVRLVHAVEANNRMLKTIMTELGLEVPETGDPRKPHRIHAENKAIADAERRNEAEKKAAQKQKKDADKRKQAEKEQAKRNKARTGKSPKPKAKKKAAKKKSAKK